MWLVCGKTLQNQTLQQMFLNTMESFVTTLMSPISVLRVPLLMILRPSIRLLKWLKKIRIKLRSSMSWLAGLVLLSQKLKRKSRRSVGPSWSIQMVMNGFARNGVSQSVSIGSFLNNSWLNMLTC